MNTTFVCPWSTRTYYIPTGQLIGKQDGFFNPTLSVNDTKSSVDTGSFIPGKYRTNPYNVSRTTVGITENEVQVTTHTSWPYERVATVSGAFLAHRLSAGLALPEPSSVSNLKQITLQKAYAKLGDTDLHLAEAIGELRLSVMTLKQPLVSLKKFFFDDEKRNWLLLKALAKRDGRTVNRLLGRTGIASADAMTGAWLEIRFGFRPLLILAQEAIAMVMAAERKAWNPNIIRSKRAEVSDVLTTEQWHNDLIGSAYIYATTSVVDRVKCNVSVQYKQRRPTSALTVLGLTPAFLPEAAWELTRLSFVVDWFLSIGPWLGTLRTHPDIDVLGWTVGVKTDREVSIVRLTSRYNWNPVQTIPGKYDGMLLKSSYNRTVNEPISFIPHLTYARNFGLYKAVDSLALLWANVR